MGNGLKVRPQPAWGDAGDGPETPPHEHAMAHITAEDFVTLCAPQITPLYRYFFHQIGDPDDAQDLMATTISKALANIGRFNPQRGTFAAWLFGIARHTLRDAFRRARPTVDIADFEPLLADPGLSLDVQLLRAEAAALLHGRVRHLPSGQREALMLRYFGELKTTEIATVLGRSEGAVSLLIHRALTTLRNQYHQEERP